MVKDISNLCRICLENGASLPIFGDNDKNCDIHSKLSLCLKEKVEDINGYPCKICEDCFRILEDACSFINKYKNSCKILENGLEFVKQETDDISLSDHVQSEEEIEIDTNIVKNECIYDPESDKEDDDLSDHHEEFFKPLLELKLKIENENLPLVIRKTKTRLQKTNTREVTNNIASSILEGQFSWDGDKWCLNPKKKLQIPERAKLLTPKTENRKRITIKIPKVVNKADPQKLCDLCGEVFKNADRLGTHKRRVHFRKNIKCLHCARTFVSNYYLSRHVKRKHDGAGKTFICDICGKAFAFRGELMSHNRSVHEKSRPKKQYKCEFCNKVYKCAKSVTVHERSVHTGDRPAQCTVCGNRFYHEDYLKEHMRLHTGETPFKCPICGRGYAQRGNMKSHLRIHRRSELDDATLTKLRPNYLRLLKA